MKKNFVNTIQMYIICIKKYNAFEI